MTMTALFTDSFCQILICNPSNPTGSVYAKHHLEALVRVLAKPENQHIWVISDEIYHELVFDSSIGETVSLASFAELKGRCVVVDGVSKAFAMTGYRLGWMAGPRHLASAVAKLQGQVTSCAGSVSQFVRAADNVTQKLIVYTGRPQGDDTDALSLP